MLLSKPPLAPGKPRVLLKNMASSPKKTASKKPAKHNAQTKKATGSKGSAARGKTSKPSKAAKKPAPAPKQSTAKKSASAGKTTRANGAGKNFNANTTTILPGKNNKEKRLDPSRTEPLPLV